MSAFREWLREGDKKFKFLPVIMVNNHKVFWNTNKSETKFLSQINDRVKAQHITDSAKLGIILEKGLNTIIDNCATGKGRENDTCIRFTKSMFTGIFNKDENAIIGIRKPIDSLNCNKRKTVFENCVGLEEFAKELDIEYINMEEIYDGIKFDFIGLTTESITATNMCKVCLEINL